MDTVGAVGGLGVLIVTFGIVIVLDNEGILAQFEVNSKDLQDVLDIEEVLQLLLESETLDVLEVNAVGGDEEEELEDEVLKDIQEFDVHQCDAVLHVSQEGHIASQLNEEVLTNHVQKGNFSFPLQDQVGVADCTEEVEEVEEKELDKDEDDGVHQLEQVDV